MCGWRVLITQAFPRMGGHYSKRFTTTSSVKDQAGAEELIRSLRTSLMLRAMEITVLQPPDYSGSVHTVRIHDPDFCVPNLS